MNIKENEGAESKAEIEVSLAKIAISKEADRALSEVLNRVTDGFDAGRATKQEIASQILLQFGKSCTDREIHAMRAQFFNPILLMEVTLRKAKETGVLPDSLRELLFQQFINSEASPPSTKRSKKILPQNIIKDNVSEDQGAF